MNPILEQIYYHRHGHYVHAVEVSEVSELENIAETVFNEYSEQFRTSTIINFLESLSIYCLDDNNEDEIFNFSFTDCINSFV